MSLHLHKPLVLSIAGLDPSGGAGVIADIETFIAFGCFPTTAITSLTIQNSNGIASAEHIKATTLRDQILAVVREHQVAGVKTGMLPTAEIVEVVAELVSEKKIPAPVIDPVIRSSSGYELIEREALQSLVQQLFPLASLVTPNLPEAEAITGVQIQDESGMRRAAKAMREIGAPAVLIKGGHLLEARTPAFESRRQQAGRLRLRHDMPTSAIDVLDYAGQVTVFKGEWISGADVRGTGCRLSAAIASCLAKSMTLEDSIRESKRFVADVIRRATRNSGSSLNEA